MLEEKQPRPPLGLTYDPSEKARFLGSDGFENEEFKVQWVSELVKGAEPNRAMAIETVSKCAGYRRNLWLIDADATGPEPKLLDEEKEWFGRDYRAIPWTIVLAWMRQGTYTALRPKWDFEVGAGRESDRYIAEMLDLLNTIMISGERQKEYRILCDQMGFGAHSIMMVEWDPDGGREVRTEEETDEKPTTGPARTLRVEKRPTKDLLNATMAAAGLAEREMEDVTVYHKLDEYGRGLYKVRKTGAPKYTALGPTSFNIDQNAGPRGVRDARWIFAQKPITADRVFEMYAANDEVVARLKKWEGWGEDLCISPTDRMIRQLNDKPTTAPGGRVAVMLDLYMKKSPQHGLPNGLRCRMLVPAGGSESNALLLEWTPWPWKLPFADGAVEVFDSNDWWGVQLMNASAPSQKETNELLSLSLEAVKDGISMIVGSKDKSGNMTGIRVSDMENVPGGKKVSWGTDVEDVKILTTQVQAQMQTQMMEKVMQMGELVASQRGTRTDEEELAAQVARAIQQDKSITGMALQSLADCMLESTILGFEFIQRHMSLDDLRAILEDYSDVEVQDLVNCDLRSSLRATLRGASLSDDPTWILQLMKFVPQLGPAWEKIYPPNVMADMLALERKFGKTPRDAQREKQQRENSIMRKRQAQVHPFDDDPVHIDELDYWCVRQWKWLTDPKFKPELDRCMEHREWHEQQMEEKMIKAAVAAVRAELAMGAAVQAIRDKAAKPAKGPITSASEAPMQEQSAGATNAG